MKTFKTLLAGVATAALFATTAQAADLTAYHGTKIDLGKVQGVAYYTVENDGYRVVATLASPSKDAFRFEAVLKPGQTVVMSTPASVDTVPNRIEISRSGDRVDVRANALTN